MHYPDYSKKIALYIWYTDMKKKVSVQEVLSDMGWKSTDDNKHHKIYIKLDDLISQTKTLLMEEKDIVTKPCCYNP
ncbi:4278_t:CDS:2 [Gigaspora margarita]|uniref:4278_t:CDS:1 n=1 Tax=Gigaspora margarita TaxID=4874 RepID=A0ABN7V9G9_GIGMA|nr:4278_t:CDS:2 [Gigaspora margarita]